MKDNLDLAEFRRLINAYDRAPNNAGNHCNLTEWLRNNREDLIRAAEERDALLRVVEAADKMRTNWSAANLTRHPLPAQYDQARTALDALRSGKPREETAQTEPDEAATTSQ